MQFLQSKQRRIPSLTLILYVSRFDFQASLYFFLKAFLFRCSVILHYSFQLFPIHYLPCLTNFSIRLRFAFDWVYVCLPVLWFVCMFYFCVYFIYCLHFTTPLTHTKYTITSSHLSIPYLFSLTLARTTVSSLVPSRTPSPSSSQQHKIQVNETPRFHERKTQTLNNTSPSKHRPPPSTHRTFSAPFRPPASTGSQKRI